MIELYLTSPENTVMYVWATKLKDKGLVKLFKEQRNGTFKLTPKQFKLLHDTYIQDGQNEYIKNKLRLLNSKILETA